MYIMKKMPKEGQKRVIDILTQCLHDHVDDIRKIAEEYGIKLMAESIKEEKQQDDGQQHTIM